MAPKQSLGHRWLKRTGTGPISENYQRRLMRSGVTESQFRDKSFKLSEARGHGETPEHPREAIKHPERYPDYRKTIRAIVKDGEQAEFVNISGLSKSQRSTVAKHRNAVLDYLELKHPKGYVDRVPRLFKKRGLKIFEGKKYTDAVSGKEYELETRERQIEDLGRRYEVAFEDFYPKVK